MLGSIMWANVWFVIWPSQQVVMASAAAVAGGGSAIPEAAARGAKAGVASRTNTMLSIPMLFFMGAASHLPMAGPMSGGQKWGALILLAIVILVVEINALAGPGHAGQGQRWQEDAREPLEDILGRLHPDLDPLRLPRQDLRIDISRPTSAMTDPNDVWTIDYKGQFKTRDGRYCYPLTIQDAATRFLLGCRGLLEPTIEASWPVFQRLFRRYGLPERIRTDNGAPFASCALGRLSTLSVWWVRLGIQPELIEPAHPEQNGRHERMHKTLKAETARPPRRTLAAQQRRFDWFRARYNTERPHESTRPAAARESLPGVAAALSELALADRLPRAL